LYVACCWSGHSQGWMQMIQASNQKDKGNLLLL
jgi:hypothetical protein